MILLKVDELSPSAAITAEFAEIAE